MIALMLSVGCLGADWPQFMGPHGDGATSDNGLLRAWSSSGPKVNWTSEIGGGYGGAAICNSKVYMVDRPNQNEDVVRRFDLETGKKEWSFRYDAPGPISHDGSRGTPAVTDRMVYTIGPFGHLHCLDRENGKLVWRKNLLVDYGAHLPRWAVAQSPLPYGEWIIISPQSDSVGVVALDRVSGAERWRSPPVGPLAYVSPRLVKIGGIDQVIVASPKGVTAVAAADGQLLWEYEHPCKIPIPNVSVLGDGRLFVTGGYNSGSAIVQVTLEGGQWRTREIARIHEMGGHCHPALVYKEHLYILCNTNERNDGMVCFDFNGKVVWQTRRDPYLCKGGSILTGDGLMYVMDGRGGELHIVEPSPDGFKSLDKAKLLSGKEIWGPLALADGRLVIRDQTHLKCIDLRAN